MLGPARLRRGAGRLRLAGHLRSPRPARTTAARCCSATTARAATRCRVVGAQGSATSIANRVQDERAELQHPQGERRTGALRDPQRRLLRGDHAREHRRRQRSPGGRGVPRRSTPGQQHVRQKIPQPTVSERRTLPDASRHRPAPAGRPAASPAAPCSTSQLHQASDPDGVRAALARRGGERAAALDRVIELDAAGARCCPSSRACAPSRTRPTTRIRSAADEDAARARDRGDARASRRAPRSSSRSSRRSRRDLHEALAPLPNLPDPSAAPGPEDELVREVGERRRSSASSRATTSSSPAR